MRVGLTPFRARNFVRYDPILSPGAGIAAHAAQRTSMVIGQVERQRQLPALGVWYPLAFAPAVGSFLVSHGRLFLL